ncbi:M16 family metallopeptidase [Campylobacter lanienae]|uniref:M16 family metallopeptidase n=1 Tax=Campylobacter lanienae TaxID=75658 RepID=UPI0021BFF16C|nr:pitrilysin family protein [Campylobacter lanienae]
MERLNLKIGATDVALIYEHNSELPLVGLKLVFKVAGICNEKKYGVAKLAAELLSEGSKKLSSNEFNKALDMRAIMLGASAGFETFEISLESLSEHFEFGFNMLLELLSSPNYDKNILKKLKTQALGVIASNSTDYDYQASNALKEILYPNSRLAIPSIGTPNSIEKITIDDIKEFIDSNLNLENMFIVLGGDIGVDEVKFDKFAKILSSGKKRNLSQIQVSSDGNLKIIDKPSEQAYIYFGSPIKFDLRDKFKLNVAMFILGSSGFGSRLMEEIRVRRGLAYSVYCSANLNLSYNSMSGYLQTKNESKDEAIMIIKDEIAKFIQDGATKEELEAAKNFLLGSEPLTKETLFKRLAIAQKEHYQGYELGEFDINLGRIKALELDELNKFIFNLKDFNNLSIACLYNEQK